MQCRLTGKFHETTFAHHKKGFAGIIYSFEKQPKRAIQLRCALTNFYVTGF